MLHHCVLVNHDLLLDPFYSHQPMVLLSADASECLEFELVLFIRSIKLANVVREISRVTSNTAKAFEQSNKEVSTAAATTTSSEAFVIAAVTYSEPETNGPRGCVLVRIPGC
jgi:hypothetical protein